MSILQEVSKRLVTATKNDETKFIWHGSVLTCLTDHGLTIFTFSKDFRSVTKEINYVECFMEHPKQSVTADLIPRSFVANLDDNLNYTSLILDPILWPHNPQLEAEATRIMSFKWAPTEMLFNNEYILATLTCTGNVELITFAQNKWVPKYNVTKQYMVINPASKTSLKTAEQLKKVMSVYTSSAICWQPKMCDDSSCYFVTMQYNNDMLIWLVSSDNATLSFELKFTQNLQCHDITSIEWIPLTNDNFIIISSDITGQVFASIFNIVHHKISVIETTCIWEHPDKMIANNLVYSFVNENITLLYSKNRHLVVQVLTKNGEVTNQYVKNIDDFKIVGIVSNEDSYYLGTANCKVYRLNVMYSSNLNVHLEVVKLPKDLSSTECELQSLSISKNNTFLTLGLLDLKLCLRKSKVTVGIVFLNNKPHDIIISELLNNPDKKLTHLWESIEYLRYRTIKTKSMPEIDYEKLYEESDEYVYEEIYKLKVYYLFLTWYHYLTVNCVPIPFTMPEQSLEKVRDKILLKHALSLLTETFKKYPNVTEFENEILNGTKRYVTHYCNKYNELMSKYIAIKVIENIKPKKVHRCHCCELEIQVLTCKKEHFSLLCILTFTFIEGDDYLTCKHCNVVARIELLDSKPRCVFCDLLLSKS